MQLTGLAFDDQIFATISGSTFTGPVVAEGGLSGSLQVLSDGTTSYLSGVGLISVFFNEVGQASISIDPDEIRVKINAFPSCDLLDGDTNVTQAVGTDFYLHSGTLTSSGSVLVTSDGAVLNQELMFWLQDTSYQYSILNLTGSIFTSDSDPDLRRSVLVTVKFDGNDWQCASLKYTSLSFEQRMTQMGLKFDINPAVSSSWQFLTLDQTRVVSVLHGLLTGSDDNSEHMPVWHQDAWITGSDIPCLVFSGSSDHLDPAQGTLIGSSSIFTMFGNGNNYQPWTIFIVEQCDMSTAIQSMFSLTQGPFVSGQPDSFQAWFGIGMNHGEFGAVSVNEFEGSYGTPIINDLTSSLKNLIEISSDGTGNLNGWCNGTVAFTNASSYDSSALVDVMTIGSRIDSHDMASNCQFIGRVARILIFNQDLTNEQRTLVRNRLMMRYSIGSA